MRYALILAGAALAGCAKEPPAQAVNITADSYCQIAEKVRWSVNDTRETISQVRRENAKHDAKCGPRTPTS